MLQSENSMHMFFWSLSLSRVLPLNQGVFENVGGSQVTDLEFSLSDWIPCWCHLLARMRIPNDCFIDHCVFYLLCDTCHNVKLSFICARSQRRYNLSRNRSQ